MRYDVLIIYTIPHILRPSLAVYSYPSYDLKRTRKALAQVIVSVPSLTNKSILLLIAAKVFWNICMKVVLKYSKCNSGDTLWSYQMQRWFLSIAAEYFYAGALRETLCCHSFCQAPRNMRCEAVNEMGSEMSSTHVSGKQCMKVDDECRRIVIELRLYSRPMPQSINWCSSRLRSLKWRHWTLVKRENQRENEIKINCILKKSTIWYMC